MRTLPLDYSYFSRSRVLSQSRALSHALSHALMLLALGCCFSSAVHAQPQTSNNETAKSGKTPGKTVDEYTSTHLATRRVALVIGNAQYKKNPLKNPHNDAADMAKKLRELGFTVVEKYDLDNAALRKSIGDFLTLIDQREEDDVVLFYYSGHGLQYNGVNYLIPIDAELESEKALYFESTRVDAILDGMGNKRGGANIVILDACRDNVFARGFKGGNGTVNKGMAAPTSAPANTYIAYATAANDVASDNPEERNGLYTGELLRFLGQPNLNIEKIFKETRKAVAQKSQNKQIPWETSSLTQDIILVKTTTPTAENPTETKPKSNPKNIAVVSADQQNWVSVDGGRFMMGCVEGDQNCELDETGEHRKRTSVATFDMMKSEVTVSMYQSCVEAGKCTIPDGYQKDKNCNWGRDGYHDHPINCVDWYQATQYCKFVAGHLPTSSEWEYAAKSGGQERIYPWGNAEADCERAVLSVGGDGCGRNSTWPVCSKPRGNSQQGICDLLGNVWEWVDDQYDATNREKRGGAWYYDAWLVRASDRKPAAPSERNYGIGFRCVR